MSTNPTNLLKLSRPSFNSSTWHDDVNGNSAIIDAAFASIGVLSNIVGTWANNTEYEIGDRVASPDGGIGLWEALVDHTSAATGSFIAELIANPDYWRPVTGGIVPKGEWQTATTYLLNDIVFIADQGISAIALAEHVSTVFEDDAALGLWFKIIDFSDLAEVAGDVVAYVDAAEAAAITATTKAAEASADADAAEASKVAAETAETNAETAETNAETARTGAETARTGAEAAETNAVAARVATEGFRDEAEAFRDEAATYAALIRQEALIIAVSDEVTALTVGAAKVTFRMPYAYNITAVKASLKTASSVGVVTVDVNKNGVSIFSTLLTIDATETTSLSAATAAVLTATPIVCADDDVITIDIDGAGTGALGLKLTIIGHQ